MKAYQFFIVGLMLISGFTIPMVAQKENLPVVAKSKIAVINSKIFEDKEFGIKDLLTAYDKLEAELKPKQINLLDLSEKVMKKEKEVVSDLPAITSNYEEHKKLICELDSESRHYKSLLENRIAETIKPITSKIAVALKQFGKRNGYAIILDKSETNYSAIIEDETVDVTKEFIQFYNNKSEKEKAR